MPSQRRHRARSALANNSGTFFPESLPHPTLHTQRCLQWLRRCGMAETLTRVAFLEANPITPWLDMEYTLVRNLPCP